MLPAEYAVALVHALDQPAPLAIGPHPHSVAHRHQRIAALFLEQPPAHLAHTHLALCAGGGDVPRCRDRFNLHVIVMPVCACHHAGQQVERRALRLGLARARRVEIVLQILVLLILRPILRPRRLGLSCQIVFVSPMSCVQLLIQRNTASSLAAAPALSIKPRTCKPAPAAPEMRLPFAHLHYRRRREHAVACQQQAHIAQRQAHHARQAAVERRRRREVVC